MGCKPCRALGSDATDITGKVFNRWNVALSELHHGASHLFLTRISLSLRLLSEVLLEHGPGLPMTVLCVLALAVHRAQFLRRTGCKMADTRFVQQPTLALRTVYCEETTSGAVVLRRGLGTTAPLVVSSQ